jgi:hypothetical protein
MTDLLDLNWRIAGSAAASKVGDETVLLHLESGTYFGLDPLGSRIWQALEAGQQPRAQCRNIAEEYDQPLGRVEDDVRIFLNELAGQDLIERQ